MKKETIFAFIIGLALGAIIIYLMCCRTTTVKNLFTEEAIKASDAYKNPDPKALLEPHEFFNKFKDKIESDTSVFSGIKIEGKYLRQMIRATPFKAYYYVAIGLDENRNKKLLIACEPKSDGVWRQGTGKDFQWDDEAQEKESIDTASIYYRQFNESDYIFRIEKDPQTQSYILNKGAVHNHYVIADPKEDWFNKVFKAIVPGTSAYAGSVCVCKTCCGKTQSSNLAPQN